MNMKRMTEQEKKWKGDFGEKYIGRNIFTPAGLDKLYERMYGITAGRLNDEFIGSLDREAKILEVGTNVGNQLLYLHRMGFKNLYGVEINQLAVRKAKARIKSANIIEGSAFDIPFKDMYFDMVFTAGVLIHISPADIKRVIGEIYRVSRKYIWGREYYSEKYQEIAYRGQKDLMWKTDFPGIYKKTFPGLRTIKERKLTYKDNDNIDIMFLLRRR